MTVITSAEAFFWASNLRHTIKFFKTLPKKAVNLNTFNLADDDGNALVPTCEHKCGSVACLGGWVAVMPRFTELGVRRDESGAPVMCDKHGERVVDTEEVGRILFGDEDGSIFTSRHELEGKLRKKSDRDIAIHRMKKQLKRIRKGVLMSMYADNEVLDVRSEKVKKEQPGVFCRS